MLDFDAAKGTSSVVEARIKNRVQHPRTDQAEVPVEANEAVLSQTRYAAADLHAAQVDGFE